MNHKELQSVGTFNKKEIFPHQSFKKKKKKREGKELLLSHLRMRGGRKHKGGGRGGCRGDKEEKRIIRKSPPRFLFPALAAAQVFR